MMNDLRRFALMLGIVSI